MKTTTTALIDDLLSRTHENLFAAEEFKALSFIDLNSRPAPGSWNVLECFEHLNYYGKFYIPEIDKQISKSPHPAEEAFRSGFLGNYFAKSMLPKEKQGKMKTLKSQDPIGKTLSKEVVDLFIDHQHQLLILLDRAKKVSLNRTKTGISISKYLRLRLGDTFRVLVYHNQRHILQAKRTLIRASENPASIKQQV